MERQTTYRVQEFAKLAGVTVRTLHYYEETGLVIPSSRTSSGHRRYRQDDLLRLQQIVTLKHLGFSLDDIRALLAAPTYDLQAAVAAQKAAIEEEIRRLQGVVYGLTRIAETLEQSHAVDWDQVISVIRGLSDADRSARLSQYFPPEQLAWLQERAAATPPDVITQGTEAWQKLYTAFGQLMHLTPEHPDVQALAPQVDQLIQLFTQNRPAIEQGLATFYQSEPGALSDFGGAFDPSIQTFMMRALALYRAQGGDHAVSDH